MAHELPVEPDDVDRRGVRGARPSPGRGRSPRTRSAASPSRPPRPEVLPRAIQVRRPNGRGLSVMATRGDGSRTAWRRELRARLTREGRPRRGRRSRLRGSADARLGDPRRVRGRRRRHGRRPRRLAARRAAPTSTTSPIGVLRDLGGPARGDSTDAAALATLRRDRRSASRRRCATTTRISRFVEVASEAVAEHLRPGALVILESTTYPGTTDEIMRPILERGGLVAGRDFALAYSPERIDPGRGLEHVAKTPKVVGRPHARGRRAREGLLRDVHPRGARRLDAARGRDGQADREHVPSREHRARQRARVPVEGPRRRPVGVDPRRRDEALRLHAVLPGPRRRRPLHRDRSRRTCRGASASARATV